MNLRDDVFSNGQTPEYFEDRVLFNPISFLIKQTIETLSSIERINRWLFFLSTRKKIDLLR